MPSIAGPGLWTGFVACVLVLLVVDLALLHRRPREAGLAEALAWSAVWIALSLGFNAALWLAFGPQIGLEFLTGWLIEKSLSVDNLFVFAVLFGSFGVPAAHQYRVLFWGVLGAMLMRAAFIGAGVAAIHEFHWVLYVFGGVLVLTGLRLLRRSEAAVEPRRNPLYRLAARLIPTSETFDGARFFTVRNGRRLATPLLLVLIAVELTDLVFAVDSIPAIFAVTRDPFIIFASNICAVLGLRALYFVLAGAMRRLEHLHAGLALVLVFVGGKMLLVNVLPIPTTVSLAVIVALVGGAAAWSVRRTRRAAG